MPIFDAIMTKFNQTPPIWTNGDLLNDQAKNFVDRQTEHLNFLLSLVPAESDLETCLETKAVRSYIRANKNSMDTLYDIALKTLCSKVESRVENHTSEKTEQQKTSLKQLIRQVDEARKTFHKVDQRIKTLSYEKSPLKNLNFTLTPKRIGLGSLGFTGIYLVKNYHKNIIEALFTVKGIAVTTTIGLLGILLVTPVGKKLIPEKWKFMKL